MGSRQRLRIRLYGGALASVSDARVLCANAAAVQNPDGDWEILQFANAELVDGSTYKVSRLLRGQAGSEYAIADPLPEGAPFVLLDTRLMPLARGLNVLDRPILVRLAAAGRNHDDPTAVALTVTPRAMALLPLSPVHVKASRESGGVRISWIRRTCIDGDGWGIEVPLGEDIESYTLDIFSGGSVVRSSRAVHLRRSTPTPTNWRTSARRRLSCTSRRAAFRDRRRRSSH